MKRAIRRSRTFPHPPARVWQAITSSDALAAWLTELEAKDDMVYFAYVDRESGKALGNGAFMTMNPDAGTIEVGSIMFSPALQQTRAATEAIYLHMAHAFDLGYRRFEWTCDDLNAGSLAAAQRFGFTYEATHRAAVASKGRERSTAIFAVTDTDWPGVRGAIDAWLDPDNFDADGQQKAKLSEGTAPYVHARHKAKPAPRVNALGQPIGAALSNWSRPPTPPQTPMVGATCTVEPLDAERHAADLFAANSSDKNWAWLPYGPFDTLSDYQDWLVNHCMDPDPMFHAVISHETGRAVGIASYLRINPTHGVIEVGHINYSPLLQRTPMATEAMILMMGRAFDLGYRRYEWKCNAANAASRGAALRLGFTYEGMTRNQLISKGCNRDTAWFGILDSEWPAIHSAYAAWSAPANFDAEGRQKKSLSAFRG